MVVVTRSGNSTAGVDEDVEHCVGNIDSFSFLKDKEAVFIVAPEKDLLQDVLLLTYQDVKLRKVNYKLVHIRVVLKDYIERYDSVSSVIDCTGILVEHVQGTGKLVVKQVRFTKAAVGATGKAMD